MKYIASFVGRKVGAIGVTYPIAAETHGKNQDEARINLYDRYECISCLKLTPKWIAGHSHVAPEMACPTGEIPHGNPVKIERHT